MSLQPQPAAAGGLLTPLRARALAEVPHGFFGRKGGVSTGIYASLNAGPGSEDAPENVAENRRRIAASLGAEHLISLYQIHSPNVVRVERPFSERPQADGMVTTIPGLGLGILTADCAPVLFADVEAGVIGAAHAGWRGALSGVLEATVAAMRDAGARRIVAAIGPAIAEPSYEIGPEFEERFLREDPASAPFFAPGPTKRRFDLMGYCVARLAGLDLADIEPLPLDTYTLAEDWFSNRRAVHAGEKSYGRNCAAIALPARAISAQVGTG